MRDVLLVRFGEVHLKGLNRPYFMKKLVDNIRRVVLPMGGRVWLSDSRIYVSDVSDLNACSECVRKVFGVHSVSPAFELDKDFEAISAQCVKMMHDLSGTFKVEARRSDKHFPMNSMEIQCELGGRVLDDNPNLVVDVHKPAYRLKVEIRDHAYLSVIEVPGTGGLPMGTGGKAMLLLSGGIDSPVAGFQLMRRGVQLQAIHFFSFPYTSERAKEKVLALAKLLGAYATGMTVYVVPFTELQLAIHEHCPDALGTVLVRRYMMRIAEKVARAHGCQALITGESIGQVASQTMEGLCATDAVVNMPIFRPLIGLDKLEIIGMANRIGTFETSILPYEDCCTVFTPLHPSTKPKLDDLVRAETRIDGDKFMAEAVAGTEKIII